MAQLLDNPAQDQLPLEITEEETGALLRAFFNLAERWRLNDNECRILLGQPAPRTYARWKAAEADLSRVPFDTRRRLSILLGIHKALRYMFHEPERTYIWIRKPNQVLGGQSALQQMLAGDIVDLVRVRDYLDAERGGW